MSKDRRKGWLAELKAGDDVVVSSNGRSRVEKVTRITPTGRVRTSGDWEFEADGTARGEYHVRWRSKSSLLPCTPDHLLREWEDGIRGRASLVLPRTYSRHVDGAPIDDVAALLKAVAKLVPDMKVPERPGGEA